MTLTLSKKLMEVIFHGYGINVTLPLKVICKDVLILQRILNILTPFSQLFQDYIVSEINQFLNEISTSQWQQYVTEAVTATRSLRRKFQILRQELLNELNLTEEEIEKSRNKIVGDPVLVLQVSRGYQAFQNSSTQFKEIIANVAMQRCKEMLKIETEQLAACATEMFDLESKELLMHSVHQAVQLIQGITFDSMLQTTDELSVKIEKIYKPMECIRKVIKKTAYSKGWSAISYFGSQNV